MQEVKQFPFLLRTRHLNPAILQLSGFKKKSWTFKDYYYLS